MRKDIFFVFNEDYKEAFKKLKTRLTSALILNYYNLERQIILELDASDGVTTGIFSQYDPADRY